jgi:outer membrane protein assembly factor BamB
MTKNTLNAILSLTLWLLILVLPASADDWPQWRGPDRNGISNEQGLLSQWPEGGPKLLWQITNLSNGYSTPSVAGDHLVVMVNEGLENETIRALNVKDGSQIWSVRVGKVGNPDQRPNFPAARSTPTVEGDRVYALGSDGDLVCLQANNGKIIWQKSLRTDFGGEPGRWAYAESPLIDGDKLICTPGGSEATLVALNKLTGEVIWKAAVPDGKDAAYASVIITNNRGTKLYVAFIGTGLVGIDAQTGTFIWEYKNTKGNANIPTPVALNDLIYSSASRTGGGLIQLTSPEDSVRFREIYFDSKLPTANGGSILIGDYMYGSNNQTLQCVEFKTGKVMWEDASIAPGSLCSAENLLYFHGENGDMALIQATPDGYHELGRFSPPDQPAKANNMEKAWVYPVVANGRLYIRDKNCLWCYDIKK